MHREALLRRHLPKKKRFPRSKLSWQQMKEEQAKKRKREAELEKVEARIEELETRDSEIDETIRPSGCLHQCSGMYKAEPRKSSHR